MKYIKTYETISKDLKKHELILSKATYSNYDYDLYILLNDVSRSKRTLDVFHIAEITFYGNSVSFEVNDLDDYRIYKNANVRVLNRKEQYLLFNNIYNSTNNNIVKRTKEVMNIDITETEDYKNFLLNKNTEKYGL